MKGLILVPISPDQAKRRASIAARKRWNPDDPQLIKDQRELKALSLEDHIRRVLDSFPPLTSGQRTELARLLAGDES